MFENKTFENILDSMLEYVKSRDSELEVNVGSIIYTALAPIALELETAYHYMDMILDETFIDTASKEYLVKFGNQVGLPINEASCCHYKAEFNVDVPIGSRFNLDKFNYTVIEKLADKTFELVCETAGVEPNDHLGTLTPITYIANLTSAKLTEVIIPGEDEEETESYRYRLQVHTKNPSNNGNLAQYYEWLDDYDGVGKYRVTPCWDGANTVKVTILDFNNTTASDELVADVQEYLDPNCEGMGNGQAPIGAFVTVTTVAQLPVVVDCVASFKDGYTEEDAVEEVKKSIRVYLESIALDKTTVEYMPIMAAVYNTACIAYVHSLIVNVNGTEMNPNADTFTQSVSIGEDYIGVLSDSSNIRGV